MLNIGELEIQHYSQYDDVNQEKISDQSVECINHKRKIA